MRNKKFAIEWLKRAEGNFIRAKKGKTSKKEFYEDFCYDCQQTAEKALKAILISENIVFEKTHSIGRLFELIETAGIKIPAIVQEADELTIFASDTRYPGDYAPVGIIEYKQALKSAGKVLKFPKTIIAAKNEKLF